MLNLLNTFVLILGYITVFYLIVATFAFLWVYKNFTDCTKLLDGKKPPLSSYVELFFIAPKEIIIEIIEGIKDERKNRK